MKKYPATIGACIDAAYKLREQRLAAQKEVDKLQEEETKLKEYIIGSFDKTDIDGARGKVATAGINRRVVAQVNDWEAFYKYIKKTGSFDLLQRRPNDAAYRERLEAKQTVPGVEPFTAISLSLTKSSKG